MQVLLSPPQNLKPHPGWLASSALHRQQVFLAKAAAADAPPSPTLPSVSPLYPSSRPNNPHKRVPSNSAIFSQQQPTSPPPQIYPITTAAPSANPHRYAVSRLPAQRTSPPVAYHIFQSFSHQASPSASPNLSTHSPKLRPRSLINGSATVDPASIPLPSHSPPTSTLSFYLDCRPRNHQLFSARHQRDI